jgi:hypothetical protein
MLDGESFLRLDLFGSKCSETHWACLFHCTYMDLLEENSINKHQSVNYSLYELTSPLMSAEYFSLCTSTRVLIVTLLFYNN